MCCFKRARRAKRRARAGNRRACGARGHGCGRTQAVFFGPMEELELRHRADSREIFALGALRAAAFATRAPNGLYDMNDVIFGGT
ncbi:MAG: dihydrodipicolinate reductase C-terminal domain-containing protein [Christensenellales bacterium]